MQITISVSPIKQGDTLIADLRALRAKILARRGGGQVREERDHELTGCIDANVISWSAGTIVN